MQNYFFASSGQSSLLKELSGGNIELGTVFSSVLFSMIYPNGLQNSKIQPFELVSPNWCKRAEKENKTTEEELALTNELHEAIKYTAISYLLFIAKETKNFTGKITYPQYEEFLLKHRFPKLKNINQAVVLKETKEKIKNAFNIISAHGELSGGDNLIDKIDMACYIYALATKSKRNENNVFVGFETNGKIEPIEYAVNENLSFRDEETIFTIKLQVAYEAMFKQS